MIHRFGFRRGLLLFALCVYADFEVPQVVNPLEVATDSGVPVSSYKPETAKGLLDAVDRDIPFLLSTLDEVMNSLPEDLKTAEEIVLNLGSELSELAEKTHVGTNTNEISPTKTIWVKTDNLRDKTEKLQKLSEIVHKVDSLLAAAHNLSANTWRGYFAGPLGGNKVQTLIPTVRDYLLPVKFLLRGRVHLFAKLLSPLFGFTIIDGKTKHVSVLGALLPGVLVGLKRLISLIYSEYGRYLGAAARVESFAASAASNPIVARVARRARLGLDASAAVANLATLAASATANRLRSAFSSGGERGEEVPLPPPEETVPADSTPVPADTKLYKLLNQVLFPEFLRALEEARDSAILRPHPSSAPLQDTFLWRDLAVQLSKSVLLPYLRRMLLADTKSSAPFALTADQETDLSAPNREALNALLDVIKGGLDEQSPDYSMLPSIKKLLVVAAEQLPENPMTDAEHQPLLSRAAILVFELFFRQILAKGLVAHTENERNPIHVGAKTLPDDWERTKKVLLACSPKTGETEGEPEAHVRVETLAHVLVETLYDGSLSWNEVLSAVQESMTTNARMLFLNLDEPTDEDRKNLEDAEQTWWQKRTLQKKIEKWDRAIGPWQEEVKEFWEKKVEEKTRALQQSDNEEERQNAATKAVLFVRQVRTISVLFAAIFRKVGMDSASGPFKFFLGKWRAMREKNLSAYMTQATRELTVEALTEGLRVVLLWVLQNASGGSEEHFMLLADVKDGFEQSGQASMKDCSEENANQCLRWLAERMMLQLYENVKPLLAPLSPTGDGVPAKEYIHKLAQLLSALGKDNLGILLRVLKTADNGGNVRDQRWSVARQLHFGLHFIRKNKYSEDFLASIMTAESKPEDTTEPREFVDEEEEGLYAEWEKRVQTLLKKVGVEQVEVEQVGAGFVPVATERAVDKIVRLFPSLTATWELLLKDVFVVDTQHATALDNVARVLPKTIKNNIQGAQLRLTAASSTEVELLWIASKQVKPEVQDSPRDSPLDMMKKHDKFIAALLRRGLLRAARRNHWYVFYLMTGVNIVQQVPGKVLAPVKRGLTVCKENIDNLERLWQEKAATTSPDSADASELFWHSVGQLLEGPAKVGVFAGRSVLELSGVHAGYRVCELATAADPVEGLQVGLSAAADVLGVSAVKRGKELAKDLWTNHKGFLAASGAAALAATGIVGPKRLVQGMSSGVRNTEEFAKTWPLLGSVVSAAVGLRKNIADTLLPPSRREAAMTAAGRLVNKRLYGRELDRLPELPRRGKDTSQDLAKKVLTGAAGAVGAVAIGKLGWWGWGKMKKMMLGKSPKKEASKSTAASESEDDEEPEWTKQSHKARKGNKLWERRAATMGGAKPRVQSWWGTWTTAAVLFGMCAAAAANVLGRRLP